MNYSEADARYIWHPYTKHFKTQTFPVITCAEGSHLVLETGEKILDGISSWWVNLHGHSHPYLIEKMTSAMKNIQQVMFAGFTHPMAVELAEKLVKAYGRNQAKTFYSDNGSTSVEVALKICFQYWNNLSVSKKRIIAFKGSYHGDTFGAMAISQRGIFNKHFWPFLFDVDFITPPIQGNEFSFKEIEELYRIHKDDIAGIIIEPMVQGAGGMVMHDSEQLDQLLIYIKTQGGLIIADEVMTGFGRTGKLFGMHHLQTTPDIVCLSKGLTGGMLPLGVTLATSKIFEAFESSELGKALLHGHSFTGNAISIAAAIASLDLLLTEETTQKIAWISEMHRNFKKSISESSLINIRTLGTILAMEIKTRSNGYSSEFSDQINRYFIQKKILLRPLGNTLYVLPPYCISEEELGHIYDSILRLTKELEQ